MIKKFPLIGQMLVMAALLFVVSCKKDPDPNPNPPGSVDMVTATINGFVLDEFDVPVPSASVSLAGTTVQTDIYGGFAFGAKDVPANKAFVKVEKAGFFHASKTLSVQEGTNITLNMRLIGKGAPTSIMATSGGTVSHNSGASIIFPANGIMDASGAAYGGEVWVYVYHLDPTLQDVYQFMPGDLVGIDNSNQEQFLASYGMMAVELTTPSGDPLQVAAGSKATLSFPVPPTIIGFAPSNIPLWFFNEESGLWSEEGSATLQGSNYVGDVTHFTWWNVDFPAGERINLQGTLVDSLGAPMAGIFFRIKLTNSWGSATGKTNNSGGFSGPVPANQPLRLEILTSRCGTVLFSQNFGPFSSSTNLGNIVVPWAQGLVQISGVLVDCSGTPTAGYIKIRGGFTNSIQASYRVNGAFSFYFNSCPNTNYNLVGVDPVNSMTSNPINLNNSVLNTNVSSVVACSAINHFITFELNGNSYAL